MLKFQWSDAGLLSISETGDHAARILRDDKGVPTSIISARGYRTRLEIKDGWLVAVANPSDHTSRITTSPQGLVTEFQNATNARTALRYDSNGKLIAIEGPAGSSLTLKSEDSSNGSSITVATGGGRSWTHSSKTEGARVVRTYTDAAGTVSTVEIDGNKRVLKTPDGTIYRLTLQADPQWGTAAWIPTVEAETPAGRRWTIAETRKGGPLNAQLQPQAHQRSITVDGATWPLSYDPSSRTIAFHTPEGGSRTTTLNDKGQPLRIYQPGSAPLIYAYDSQSRLKSITHGEDAEARQWRYEFNPAERTVTTIDPLGKKRVLSFDQSGHATALRTPEGNKIAVERNELEQVTAFSPPGRSTTRWSYRQDGAGRIKNIDTHPGSWRAEYDPKTGLAAQLEGAGETVTLAYDGPQVISETWSGMVSARLTREFDGQGRVVAENIGDSSKVEYRYDQADRLVQAGELTITRNPSTGQIQSERLGILERTWRYNPFGETVGTAITSAGKPIYKLTVGRDKLGRVTERIEQLPNGKTNTRIFSYDKEDRLASFQDNHGPITKYTYDANGNLVRESSDGKTIEATYDGQDKLTRRGSDLYEYDPAGRLAASTTKNGKTSYEYDRAGHLLSITLPSGKKVLYAIDGEGRRVGRSIDGKLTEAYVYADLLRPAAELDANGKILNRFVHVHSLSVPTYVIRASNLYLVVTDEPGTPRLLVDAASATVFEEMNHDPWGRGGDKAQSSLPFGLAGGLSDPDTELVRFGARDYSPSIARWTAPDPIGLSSGDFNFYRYVMDDPTNWIDPLGFGIFPCDVMAVGGSAGLGNSTYGAGIVTGGTDLGLYGSVGLSTGVDAKLNVQITCLRSLEPSKPGRVIERFGGNGGTFEVGGGPGGAGYDVSLNDDGTVAMSGGHVSVGPNVGESVGPTRTGVWCWTCSDKSSSPTPWPADGPHAYRHDGSPELLNACGLDPVCRSKQPNQPAPVQSGLAAPPFLNPTAYSSGDPHLKTADSFSFDFMAVSEFTALRSDSGDMVVQVRQAPFKDSRWVSVTPAVAISVNDDRIMIEHSNESLLLRINSKSIDLKGRINLPKGGFLLSEGRSYLIGWPDGSVLRVLRNVRGLDLSMGLAEGRKGTVFGLLGPFTGKHVDAIVTKTGASIKSDDINYKRLYREYGDSWRITQAESLFDYEPGKSGGIIFRCGNRIKAA